MSAPRNRPYSGYPGYQQPRFSQQEKLRGSDKVALWCGVAGWIMIILLLACGFVLYAASVNGEHSEYAGLSFIVPFIFGGSFLGIVNLVGFLAGFIGIGSSVTPRQRSWGGGGGSLNAAPWVIVGVAYVLIDVWVRISISSY